MIATLETQQLKLIPPSISCYELYKSFYTDAIASKMYGGPISVEQVWTRLKADIGSWHLLGYGVWVIQKKSDESLIGTCGFWKGKDWPKELTWWVMPEGRGKGVATEASKAAIHHAYNKFKWDSVETYMNDDNIAARSLVEKLGGKKIARKKFPDDLSRDIYQLPKPAIKALK